MSVLCRAGRYKIKNIMKHTMPRHIAIIPDGNRRWARKKGYNDSEGHAKGFLEVSPVLLKYLWTHGIHTVTLWMFSTDNWSRKPDEVNYLMILFDQFLDLMLKMADEYNLCMLHLGRKDRIPGELCDKIHMVESKTNKYNKGNFLFALDYSGRDEMERALHKFCSSGERHDPESFSRFLDTGQVFYPDPEIIIRTSGEIRTSGFMPWQSIYSEYFFLTKYYPDLSTDDLDQVIKDYFNRDKRYGN